MTRRTIFPVSCLLALFPLSALAQPAPADPDWPCQQRLVPHLTAGSYWSGAAVTTGDYSWRDDPALTKLVEDVVNRDTPEAEAAGDLVAYKNSLPKARRSVAAAKLFGFIVDETNDERDQVIARIDQLSRRQRNLDTSISSESAHVDALPTNTTGEAAGNRADLTGQRDFNIHTFQEAQSTIRYACEVPGIFERRLGVFAKTLQDSAGK